MKRLDVSSLSRLEKSLRALPKGLALRIAAKAAPVISRLAQSTFDTSADPYGVPWAPGVGGDKITLRQTGALERFVRYVAIGTKLRVALGVAYAKYQIGKRPVYPRPGILPPAYRAELAAIAQAEIAASVIRGAA